MIFNFSVDELQLVENAYFQTFVSESTGGYIIIKLNGKTVYDAGAQGALDVELPANWLEPTNNEIKVSVSSPGLSLRKNTFFYDLLFIFLHFIYNFLHSFQNLFY